MAVGRLTTAVLMTVMLAAPPVMSADVGPVLGLDLISRVAIQADSDQRVFTAALTAVDTSARMCIYSLIFWPR